MWIVDTGLPLIPIVKEKVSHGITVSFDLGFPVSTIINCTPAITGKGITGQYF